MSSTAGVAGMWKGLRPFAQPGRVQLWGADGPPNLLHPAPYPLCPTPGVAEASSELKTQGECSGGLRSPARVQARGE